MMGSTTMVWKRPAGTRISSRRRTRTTIGFDCGLKYRSIRLSSPGLEGQGPHEVQDGDLVDRVGSGMAPPSLGG